MSVSPGVMATKLLPPRADAGIIERPRLVERLSQNGRGRITLLTAPAGYGKTVLILQFVRSIKKPVVWYQLDAYDNDPAVFLGYLIAGIRRHLPDFGGEALRTISERGVANRLRLLETAFVNELAARAGHGLVIVLDDYHAISDSTVHRFVKEFLNHLPNDIHVVIASRIKPPFSLARRFMAGEVVIVGADELRFTRAEIDAFVSRRHGKVSSGDLETLEAKTGGWPAALRLAGISCLHTSASCKAPSPASLSSGRTEELYEYLATEVLDQQTEDIRLFLLATSVLEAMTAENCDLLLGRADSHQVLEYLEKTQFLVIPLGVEGSGEKKAYRYHQLFREFLLDRLGTERTLWLQRAGAGARKLGDLEASVEYFVRAGAVAESAEVIREAGREALRHGRWQTVARWLESLPGQWILADSWLALYRGVLEVYRGRLDEAENWATRATELFAGREERVGVAEGQLLQARILRCRMRFEESLRLLELAEPVVAEANLGSRFDLPLEISLILFLTGRFTEAEFVLTKALKEAERENDGYIIAHLAEGLGNVHYMLGDYAKALQMYRYGAETSPERVLPSYYTQDSISTIYEDWGEFQQAFDYARRSAEIKEKLGLTEALPSAYIQLATLYADRGQLKVAEEYYNRAITVIREHNGERFYLALNLAWLARCLALQGRWVEAKAKAEEAIAEIEDPSSLAWAVSREISGPILIQTGSINEGLRMLHEGVAAVERMGFRKAVCHGYTSLAWAGFLTGDAETAREFSQKCLELSAQMDYVYYFLTSYEMLQPILRLGLENGTEVAFIQRLLVRVGTPALGLLLELAAHPEPEVRRRVVTPLAEIGGPRAKRAIRSLLADSDEEVRELSRSAAYRLGIDMAAKGVSGASKVCLELECLGQFRAFTGGVEIAAGSWRTTKTRDILAYLMHRGEPARREAILEDLWPGSDPRKATALFHTTLYHLRAALEEACHRRDLIVYANGRYQLTPGCFASDYRRFEELVTSADNEETTAEEREAQLEEAVALYRGEYLEDLDYNWVLPLRESLRRSYLEARERLGRHYLEANNFSRAISHLRALTQANPLSEEAHRLLMSAYAGSGDRLAVRRQYQALVSMLNEELGLSPSAETKRLYYRLCGEEEKRSG